MAGTCFDMNSCNIQLIDINFFKELYALMDKYNIHRIYTVYLDKKKLIIAQQLLNVSFGTTKLTNKIFSFCEKNLKWLYFKVFLKNHIFRYKLKLKSLLNKYGIEKIKATSFNLYQGIHVKGDSLCIREIDLVFKDGNTFHIDSLKLDI